MESEVEKLKKEGKVLREEKEGVEKELRGWVREEGEKGGAEKGEVSDEVVMNLTTFYVSKLRLDHFPLLLLNWLTN